MWTVVALWPSLSHSSCSVGTGVHQWIWSKDSGDRSCHVRGRGGAFRDQKAGEELVGGAMGSRASREGPRKKTEVRPWRRRSRPRLWSRGAGPADRLFSSRCLRGRRTKLEATSAGVGARASQVCADTWAGSTYILKATQSGLFCVPVPRARVRTGNWMDTEERGRKARL